MRRLLDSTIGRVMRPWARARHSGRARRFAFHYEHVLGTSLELFVEAVAADVAARAEAAVLEEIDRLEPILSGWSEESELSRWLRAFDEDVAVSPELADVLQSASAWRALTQGAFDPGAQAVVELLRGARDEQATAIAMRSLLDELPGPMWEVSRASGTARRLARHAVSLDAIAKGYIVRAAAAKGRAVPGVSGVLLNVGGDIQHLGASPVAVGVADPFAPADNAAPIAVVRLANEAIATSGGYRRGFDLGGRRVSHIVDPRTGRPAERIVSASVVAPDCATADALSTAFSVMAPDESVALGDRLPGIGCLLVEADGAVTANAAWTTRALRPRHDTTHSR